MLKFYLEHDIDKAVDFGSDLIDEVGPILKEPSVQDLKFSVATAHSLKCDGLEGARTAINIFEECLYEDESEQVKQFPELQLLKGIVLNNLGMTERFKAIEWMKLF